MKKKIMCLIMSVLVIMLSFGCGSKKDSDVNKEKNKNGNYAVTTTNITMGSVVPEGVKLRSTAEKAMADWADITGKKGITLPFYLKFEFNDKKEITASYIEFVINAELKAEWKKSCLKDKECESMYDNLVNGTYTLKAGDNGESYDANIKTIKKALNYDSQPDICHDGGPEFYCDINNLYVSARGFGDVNIRSGNNSCRISSDGISYCE